MGRLTHTAAALLTAAVTLGGCNSEMLDGPDFVPGGLNVLFIGNSLTYTNSLPAVLAEMARATGARTLNHATVAGPDMSLEDHWHDGAALAAIRAEKWDFVVMQQGPSSLPANQAHLRTWAGRFAAEIRANGGTPALYMVWPASHNPHLFDAVVTSYAAAAEAAGAELLPAGSAWLDAWSRDPELPLYGPDGFHPSRMGTYLAALVMYRRLFDRSVDAVPTELRGVGVTIGAAQGALLKAAAAAVTQ
jgi:hypothetical protein